MINKGQAITSPANAQGSSFTACPLCGKSVIKALLNLHVNSCQGGPPLSADEHGPGAASKEPVEGGTRCCGATQLAGPSTGAEEHDAGAHDAAGAAKQAHERLQGWESTDAHEVLIGMRLSASPAAEEPVSMPRTHSTPAAAAQCPPRPAGHSAPKEDAFSHLMRQQRECSQTWTFFLGARPGSGFFWHIWRDSKGAGATCTQ